MGMDEEYWVPEHVREYLRGLGFVLPLESMEPHIRAWHEWMQASGSFYDYKDTDGVGRLYEVHRRSIHPAMRVCREWGSLLLNDKTQVVCADQKCTEWLETWLAETGFMAASQATVVRAFGMGTGAWALWVDADAGKVRVRHYDARMVVPLTWDEEGVTECAFVTRAFYRGRVVDQLQMHLRGGGPGFSASSSPSSEGKADDGTFFSPSKDASGMTRNDGRMRFSPDVNEGEGGYRIVTACFDEQGNEVAPAGVCPVYETGSPHPTFAIVRPAIDNTRVDMSPYGQSVFADAVDAIQAVGLAFDAMISEVDNGKMCVFLSDVLFDQESDGKGRKVSIPFGRQDCPVFRKVMSTEDTIREFAPALRTDAQAKALKTALQMLGDLTGFGISYFDFDGAGYVKTATEVSSDNSALMRNIRRHEHALEGAIAGICRAVMAASRSLGAELPEEGEVRVTFDDSIITDTSAEKQQDMAEVAAGLMEAWGYRDKWYGEDEVTARSRRAAVMVELPRMAAGTGAPCAATAATAGGGWPPRLFFSSFKRSSRSHFRVLGGRRMSVFVAYQGAGMDSFLIYLLAVNAVAFLSFTIDFLLYKFADRERVDHRVLSLFAVAGGGVGMLLAFLLWDRHVVKDNVAWRFIAVLGIIVWALVTLCVYRVVRIDVGGLLAPLDLASLAPVGIYVLTMSAVTFCVFVYDKWQAEHGGWRVREFVLLMLSLLGGAVGGLLAMHLVRHKTRVYYFAWGLPIMIILQAGLVIYARLAGII